MTFTVAKREKVAEKWRGAPGGAVEVAEKVQEARSWGTGILACVHLIEFERRTGRNGCATRPSATCLAGGGSGGGLRLGRCLAGWGEGFALVVRAFDAANVGLRLGVGRNPAIVLDALRASVVRRQGEG